MAAKPLPATFLGIVKTKELDLDALILADLHVGSVICSFGDIPVREQIQALFDTIEAALEMGQTVILIGDIFDLNSCDKKDVSKVTFALEMLRDRAIRSKKKIYFKTGNHESQKDEEQVLKLKDVLFAHSDREKYGYEKHLEMRAKKHGRPWWKFSFALKAFDKLRKWTRFSSINKEYIDRIVSLAFGKGTVFVGAHVHPPGVYDEVHSGVRVIILKRGGTYIKFRSKENENA